MSKRVCDSIAGKEPKMIRVKGRSAHWRIMDKLRHFPYLGGLGGKSSQLIAAETTMPIIAMVMIWEVIRGKL